MTDQTTGSAIRITTINAATMQTGKTNDDVDLLPRKSISGILIRKGSTSARVTLQSSCKIDRLEAQGQNNA